MKKKHFTQTKTRICARSPAQRKQMWTSEAFAPAVAPQLCSFGLIWADHSGPQKVGWPQGLCVCVCVWSHVSVNKVQSTWSWLKGAERLWLHSEPIRAFTCVSKRSCCFEWQKHSLPLIPSHVFPIPPMTPILSEADKTHPVCLKEKRGNELPCCISAAEDIRKDFFSLHEG